MRTTRQSRPHRVAPAAIATIVASALISGHASAQTISDNSGSASVSYFSPAQSSSNGGEATSPSYKLTASLGELIVESATSSNYALTGGFVATLDMTGSGPWLTAADRRFLLPRSTEIVRLAGTGLDDGPTSVTVGGRPATLVSTSNNEVAIRMPSLPDPGWQQIVLTNNSGTTSLERGVGVLPIMFTDGAAGSEVPFDLVFKGTQGDLVVWALGASPVAPIPLGSYLYGLTVDPSFLKIQPSLVVSPSSGELRFPIPPIPFTFTIYAQAVFVSSNPGYAPGSFSNRLRF